MRASASGEIVSVKLDHIFVYRFDKLFFVLPRTEQENATLALRALHSRIDTLGIIQREFV